MLDQSPARINPNVATLAILLRYVQGAAPVNPAVAWFQFRSQALRRLEPQHDKALVNGIPVSLETRLVAATSFVAVPDMMFHRADSGRQLLQDMMKSPLYAQAPAGFRQQVEALAAKARK